MEVTINHLKEIKSNLRSDYIDANKRIQAASRREMSDKICSYAVGLSAFRLSETILLYSPKEIEADVIPIASRALELKKKIAFPRCEKKAGGAVMTFHLVDDLSSLSPGSFGLLEPPDTAPVYDPRTDTHSSLCFIPGVAFDKHGYRLGHGGGYYDRYFANYTGSLIGVTFGEFVAADLPRGRYDIRMSLLITEEGVKFTSET